jgi:hypothetical protein
MKQVSGNEERRATNEEVQSTNEELQSSTEECATPREEMQSLLLFAPSPWPGRETQGARKLRDPALLDG